MGTTERDNGQQRTTAKKMGTKTWLHSVRVGLLQRNSQESQIWRQTWFKAIPSLPPFWVLVLLDDKRRANHHIRQGNKGQLIHAKCCSLDGSPHTLEIS